MPKYRARLVKRNKEIRDMFCLDFLVCIAKAFFSAKRLRSHLDIDKYKYWTLATSNLSDLGKPRVMTSFLIYHFSFQISFAEERTLPRRR